MASLTSIRVHCNTYIHMHAVNEKHWTYPISQQKVRRDTTYLLLVMLRHGLEPSWVPQSLDSLTSRKPAEGQRLCVVPIYSLHVFCLQFHAGAKYVLALSYLISLLPISPPRFAKMLLFSSSTYSVFAPETHISPRCAWRVQRKMESATTAIIVTLALLGGLIESRPGPRTSRVGDFYSDREAALAREDQRQEQDHKTNKVLDSTEQSLSP